MSEYKYIKRPVVNSWLKLILGVIIVVCGGAIIGGSFLGEVEPFKGILFGIQFAWGITLICISIDLKRKRVPLTPADKLRAELLE